MKLVLLLVLVATTIVTATRRPHIVVVGGGNSGCAVASRLSENPNVNVLLITTGFEDDYKPLTAAYMNWWTVDGTNPVYVGDNPTNVAMLSNEGPNHGKKRQIAPWCTVPGGCSGTNGQVWGRNLDDYNDAVANQVGDSLWNAANVNARRKTVETFDTTANLACHGYSGPINISSPEPEPTLIAIKQAISTRYGIPLMSDSSCGASNIGVGNLVRNIEAKEDGITYVRQNSYFEMIEPLLSSRPNLKVSLGSNALTLETANHDPTDVKCLTYTDANSELQEVCPRLAIVLSMGAINTPKFLMHNGFGDCDWLSTMPEGGLECKIHQPNIGKHLKNQVAMSVAFGSAHELRVPMSGVMSNYRSEAAIARGESLPDMQLAFGEIINSVTIPNFGTFSFVLGIVQLNRYQDEGFINITSADRQSSPFISYNFGLNHPEDLETLAKGLLEAQALANDVSAAGHPFYYFGDSTLVTIPAIVAAIKSRPGFGDTNWHITGGVRMGASNDTTRACDSRGVIHSLDNTKSVKGLYIADNSITPIPHVAHASASGAVDAGLGIADAIIADFNLNSF